MPVSKRPARLLPGYLPQGPLYNRSCVNLASMTDGTSQTAFFSERRRGQGTPDIKNDMYMMNNALTIDQTWQMCNTLDMTMAMPLTSWMGATWAIGDMTCTTYNHVSTPNTRTCAGIAGGMMMPGSSMANMAVQLPPSSYHPGGVNLSFGDGSVRFIKDTVALAVWRRLEHAERRRDRERLGLLILLYLQVLSWFFNGGNMLRER